VTRRSAQQQEHHMKLRTLLVSIAIAASGVAQAQSASSPTSDHAAHHSGNAPTAPQTDGEVRKVDKENNKITLKHGEITNLGMPAMTMVFRVNDAALLDTVQVGAKVRFTAAKDSAGFIVTAIETVP
jgi:Cu(I)/Ag(I) efflux system protein CusF